MNIIHIAGNLGSDPVTRFTATGQKVTSFTVAVNLRKGPDNVVTVWYRVTVWGDRFEKMLTYFKKGSSIIVIGELQKPEIWTDREGRPQVTLEVTAEILRFSPFGSGKQQQSDRQSPQEHPGHADGGFGEQTFQGGSGGSPHQRQEQHEEEELPF